MKRSLKHAFSIVIVAIALSSGSLAIAQTCNDCGQVMSIRLVEEKGKGSGSIRSSCSSRALEAAAPSS